MFKALANLLHRVPWWGMVLFGFFTMLALTVFTVPFQVINLEKAGATAAENQAIKREVDAAFAGQGLDIAENFVRAFATRTKDPVRQVELERALEEIQRAREEIDAAARATADATREATASASEAKKEARRAMKEAADEARNAARDSLIAAREAALEGAQAALDGQKNALKALRDAGVKDSQVEGQISAAIRQAEQNVAQAKRRLADAKANRRSVGIRVDLGDDSDKPFFEFKTGDGDKVPAAPPAKPAAPAVSVKPVAPAVPGKPAAPSVPAAPAAPEPPEPPLLADEFRADIHEKVADDFFRLTFGAILIVIFIPLFLMALIAKFFIDRARFAQGVAEEKKKEADVHSMHRQVTEARLQALQAQVEPHFLYNTLANVQALTEADPAAASKMVEHLIQYLRAALPKMRETTSTVGQEMELVRAYLNILKIRMGARLEFSINVPDDVAKLPFPPLMLPSLIENAIKHGLEPQREGGRIDITASRLAGLISIEVKDTGRGFGTGTSGGGVGLANIRERLEGLYGAAGKLTLTENEPKGFIATLQVPETAPRSIDSVSATGFSASAAAPAPAPATMQSRIWGGVKTAHNIWLRIALYTFVALIGVLIVGFIVGLVGAYTGLLPLQIGHAKLSGLEGVALGTIVLLAAFAILAVVALVLVALFYGLGVMAAALVVIIPLLIVVSVFPALLPFVLIGLVVWWFMRKKQRKEKELPTLQN